MVITLHRLSKRIGLKRTTYVFVSRGTRRRDDGITIMSERPTGFLLLQYNIIMPLNFNHLIHIVDGSWMSSLIYLLPHLASYFSPFLSSPFLNTLHIFPLLFFYLLFLDLFGPFFFHNSVV